MAVALEAEPTKARELLGYQYLIAKASWEYRWPSWVFYDQTYRKNRSGDKNR